MDAHFFRILAQELGRLLEGARLEKIHGPLPGTLVFSLFTAGLKRRLVFRFERRAPLLFFTDQRLPNPERPTAAVMRLRKYCSGRRLGKARSDFASRRLLFSVPGGQGEEYFLLLDMAEGAFVLKELPPDFGREAAWPDPGLIHDLCDQPWRKGEKDGPWQQYAVLTPLLRESLAALPAPEALALMVDLEAGGGDVFLYAQAPSGSGGGSGDSGSGGRAALYAAWPLPPVVCARRGLNPAPLLPLAVHEQDAAFLPWLAASSQAAALLAHYPACACAALAGEPELLGSVSAGAKKEADQPLRKAEKKRHKLLHKLEREKERLTAMLALREEAKLLQGALWQYTPEEKRAEILLPGANGAERRICLNPALSVRENMARMFKESARGARGLAMLEERLRFLRAEAPLPEGRELAADGKAAPFDAAEQGEATPLAVAPGYSGARPAPPKPGAPEYPGVARFISSDGFTLLRGKNAKGNQSLKKIGSGHDLWLHAETGPSAHLIIRRSHAAETVPERTLFEAAALVAEKSRYRDDARADIMVAELKFVLPIKGAAPGTVRVDKVLRVLRVAVTTHQEESR